MPQQLETPYFWYTNLGSHIQFQIFMQQSVMQMGANVQIDQFLTDLD